MMKVKIICFIVSSLCIVQGSVLAKTGNTTFQSNATLSNSCSISANNIDFGDITQLGTSGQTVNRTLSLNVLCSNQTSYKIGLNAGLNTQGSFSRYMKGQNSGELLQYGFCKSNTFSTNPFSCADPWATDDTIYYYSGMGTGSNQTITGYAFTRAGLYTPDNYSDTITAILSF